MTAVKDSVLYKSLCKSVRKEDHAELLRMLEMVYARLVRLELCKSGFRTKSLSHAFWWFRSPQGGEYWKELSRRIRCAGFDNW